MKMEKNKTCILKKLTAFAMALIMVLSVGITPAFAAEEDFIAAVGEELYVSLQAAADEAENGETVELLCDASGDGIFVKGDKSIIFDFGGYTYTVDGKLVGSNGTQSQAMHLEKGAEVTLRNGTLKAGGDVRMLVQNYCELTLVDFSLDTNGKEIYALSNNFGNVLVTGKSNITSEAAAFDLWYNLQGGYPEGISVTFDENYEGTVKGNIEYGAYKNMNTEGWTEKVALTIKNGTFLGEIEKSSDFAEKANITVYGGSFSDADVADYCAEYHTVAAADEGYRVIPCVSDGEGKAYASLQQAVDAAEGEATVKLNCDLSGDGIFVAGDKNIIFDFGGYTYTVDGKLVGSNGTQSQAMHLEKGAKVTLRNGTLKAGGDVRMLVQNYCELTLVDFSLDTNGKEIYALSNN
ncbi:MAG: hypothetical protein E7543_08320, partial [Ruminococcaceae bacterium]|nr:hypothetical protein [Oscillospiraceae bacterium]